MGWLNDNKLSSLIDICKKHGITIDQLLVADLDDFKDLCKVAQISTMMMLNLKRAIMKESDSVIAKQSYNPQKQIIVISQEEKKMKDKFDRTFDKLSNTLQQNEQNQTDLESQKKSAVQTVNSSMDELIKLIEIKRRNLIDEVDATIIEKTQQLNEQKIKGNQLKQLFMDKKKELDNLSIIGAENDGSSINQIVDENINKYKQFQQKFGDISCIISPVIDMNEMDAAITKSCYLKVNELMMNNDNDNDDDDNKEEQEQECKTEKCKFSDRYRGQFGLLSLNDDKSVLSKP